MADDNSEKIERYNFLFERKAQSVFARLDYSLKNGIHIQREYPLMPELYRFLNENYISFKHYYKDFFNLNLCREGSEFNQYYFLDVNEIGRGSIPADNKDYLKTEHVIIGMLFLKMFRMDGNIELDSITGFTALLYEEYEEEKKALRKLINDNSSDKGSDLNDQRFENTVKKAFYKFGELGWLMWDDEDNRNKFKIMPSFERLRAAYQPQIETIDVLLKEMKDVQ